MAALYYSAISLFGLAVGSFLNCLIYRLEKGESFLRGRSYCPHCKHVLAWQDLIPLLSFLFLRGKCHYCQKSISWQYPVVEIATALLFLLILLLTDYPLLVTGYWLLVTCFLIIIFVYDLKHYIIPDKVVYPAIAIVFLFRILDFGFALDFKSLINPFASAFLAALFFFSLVFISKGTWMGAGDIKLAFLLGLFLGWPNILAAMFSAFFIGAIIGVGLVFAKKKKLKSEVPFGPFLVGGTFLALFWGQNIINWYFNLIYF